MLFLIVAIWGSATSQKKGRDFVLFNDGILENNVSSWRKAKTKCVNLKNQFTRNSITV